MSNPIDIKHYLPHRKPMLMVDMILSMDNEKVLTVFKIAADNIFIKDDAFIESGLIENAAQTCSAIVAKDFYVDENNQDKDDVSVIGFISALKTLRIHSLPKVGDTITTKAALASKFITEAYTLCTMDCRTFLNDELLLEGEINLFIQETPQPANPNK